MTHAAARSIEALTPVWRELATHTPVKLCAIESEKHYREMVGFMNGLVDAISDRKAHPLMGLLDAVTSFIHDHEARNVEIPQAKPADALRLLMQQHELRQIDLSEIFGSQSNVSEVLSGKRGINARQARLLAKRFGVSPAVFI